MENKKKGGRTAYSQRKIVRRRWNPKKKKNKREIFSFAFLRMEKPE
jgi:hypothetical protein